MRVKNVVIAFSLALVVAGCSSGSDSETTDVEMGSEDVEVPVMNLALGAVDVAYPNGFTVPGHIRTFAESIGVSAPKYRYQEGAIYYLLANNNASVGPSDIIGVQTPTTVGQYAFWESMEVGRDYLVTAFTCSSAAARSVIRTFPYPRYAYTTTDWSGKWGDRFYINRNVSRTYSGQLCSTPASVTARPIGWQEQEVSLAGPTTNPMARESVQVTPTALGDSIERGALTYSVTGAGCAVTATGAVTKTSGGDCVVKLSVAQGRTYLEGSAEITITFDPLPLKPISVSAADASAVAGSQIVPTLSVVSGSLDSGDTIGSATFTYEGTGDTTYGPSTAPPTSVGTYSVTPSELQFSVGDAASYVTTFAAGTLTIAPREISIAATDVSSEVGKSFDATARVSQGELLSGDELGSATFTYEGTGDTSYGPSTAPPTAVGTYSVTPSGVQFSAGDRANYSITYAAGTLTIAPREISVAATDVSSEVGKSFDATVRVSQGELLSGDELGSVTFTYEGTGNTTYGPSTAPPTAVGTYSVTPSDMQLTSGYLASYSVTYEPGAVLISTVAVEISAVGATVTLGDSFDPAVTVSSGSLLAGDAIGTVTYTYEGLGATTYGPSTDAPTLRGSYSVTPSALKLLRGDVSNYRITYAAAALGIGERPIEISATDIAITSGESFTAKISVSLGSLLSGDALGSATFTFKGVGDTDYPATTTPPSAAGTYSITPSDAALSSGSLSAYSIVYKSGRLTITEPVVEKTFTSAPTAAAPNAATDKAAQSTSGSATAILTPPSPVLNSDGSQIDLAANSKLVLQGPTWSSLRAIESEVVVDGGSMLVRPVDGSNSFTLRLSAMCGDQLCGIESAGDSSTSEARLVLEQASREVQISGTGYKPGMSTKLWIFSEPTSLGTAFVGSDGSFTLSLDLASIEPGPHTIQVNSVRSDESVQSANLAVFIKPANATLPQTGRSQKPANSILPQTGRSHSLPAVTALILFGYILMLISRRRMNDVQ